jgi:hypothetical protein
MEVFTFLLPTFLGLVLGGGSRYVGFGRTLVRSLDRESRWTVIVLIVLWIVAPFIVLVLLAAIGGACYAAGTDDLPYADEAILGLIIILGLVHLSIAFAIGWLAGPEAHIPYRPRNPFQEDVPPVFLFQSKPEVENNWLDFPVEKDEAA